MMLVKIEGEIVSDGSAITYTLPEVERNVQAGTGRFGYYAVVVNANTCSQIATFKIGTAAINDPNGYSTLTPGFAPTIAANTTGWASPGGSYTGFEFLLWLRPVITFGTPPTSGGRLAFTYYIIIKD